MRTVITHFYNEEYLLPRWLEHHKKYFDTGLLIDYNSTDRSVEICRDICPDWIIMPSGNQYFDARACDYEVMFYERQIPGWRIALTVTEFLVGVVDKLMHSQDIRSQWLIPSIRFTCWDPQTSWDPDQPLWKQQSRGISYKHDPLAHQCRSLHNFNDIEYTPGRHFPVHNTEEAMIFHYAHCIKGPEMLKRRLQIQHRISPGDRGEGLGTHHYIDENGLDETKLFIMHRDWISVGETDCSDLINSVVQ